VPKLPSVGGELAGAIRRGRAEGRLGPEHRLDVARARLLAGMLVDESTPRSAIAALDRRLDVILARLGFVSEATGPSELEEWLAGLSGEELAAEPDPELEVDTRGGDPAGAGESSAHDRPRGPETEGR
jgi:hypothetical protein